MIEKKLKAKISTKGFTYYLCEKCPVRKSCYYRVLELRPDCVYYDDLDYILGLK